LRSAGIAVDLYKQQFDDTPDSLFPNNWISTHFYKGQMKKRLVFSYPMKCENRQREFNVKMVQDTMKVKNSEFIDLAGWHYKQKYLEGTGVLIFDTYNEKLYVNLSPRADKDLLIQYLENFNLYVKNPYKAVTFKAVNDGHPIYHTNVMLGMLTEHAVVSLESIKSKKERIEVIKELTAKDINKKPKKLIDISLKEVNEFCGNVL